MKTKIKIIILAMAASLLLPLVGAYARSHPPVRWICRLAAASICRARLSMAVLLNGVDPGTEVPEAAGAVKIPEGETAVVAAAIKDPKALRVPKARRGVRVILEAIS